MFWALGCCLLFLVLLFSIKKSFAAQAAGADTCRTETAAPALEPLWESISHQFVSSVCLP
ncbi:MAG: hypothetical protein JWP27_2260 [Flaviaesturariibacter sp.]|nr:hypothetical protein [Flaviaesturariibacter sp.]